MALPQENLTLPARGWRISPLSAGIAAAACWTGFAVMVGLVASERTVAIDSLGLMFWRESDGLPVGPPVVLESVRDVTALGGVLLRNIFALGAVVALLFMRLRREASLLALTVVSGWVINTAIKLVVGRPRPQIVPHLTEAGGASFPSGHSFNSAVVYIAMALAFATMSARESVRLAIVLSAVVVSMAIAWSRVWLGVHYPSDVVAGWMGGAGWAFLAAATLQRPVRLATHEAAHSD